MRSRLGEEQRGKRFRQRQQHWVDFEALRERESQRGCGERQEPVLRGLTEGLCLLF